jgi:L-lactate dehydrogenase
LEEFCDIRKTVFDQLTKNEIDNSVRHAAYTIISGKGATYYGIGSALARIVEVILNDQRSILTVCSPVDEIAGVSDVAISLPHLVGGEGSLATFPLPLSEEEQKKLYHSAKIVREIVDKLIL